MPLIRKTDISDGFLALWERDESTDQLLRRITLSEEEQAYYDTISVEHRRQEWLTWHVMIRELIGPKVLTGYDGVGAPVLKNAPGHVSVSHSGPYVALYYRQERCGLDIENIERKYERVVPRYISPQERNLLKGDPDNRFFALMWSTKEAVYKYAGVRGLDFLDKIRVVAIDIDHALVSVSLSGETSFPLRYEFFKGHCLAYTL